MSSTQTFAQHASGTQGAATVDQKLEVLVIPVGDVDRAKRFYEGLGWRLDADFSAADGFRVVQLTPPGSPCSIQFGTGLTTATPGSAQNMYLVVDDVETARADLVAHGAAVSDTFHYEGIRGPRLAGPDPERRSYRSWAAFSDPDGNSYLLQEIKTRLPGRGFAMDVPALTDLLRDAEQHHGQYEPTAPKHHWSDFYAAYIVARAQGKTPEDAFTDGVSNVERVRQ